MLCFMCLLITTIFTAGEAEIVVCSLVYQPCGHIKVAVVYVIHCVYGAVWDCRGGTA